MPHSCPQCAAIAALPPSGAAGRQSPSRAGGARSAVAGWCLRVIGWHRLERLLASIPDSNDDFGLV
ncbi:hypothetical protein [Burkholderia stabilis]|uniref:hypothetical protein n=1 Tax=Burkholderia stabilis TaxID=95485 RepID=UPI0015915196|nr:hypothetical protein [Burkholderia stabilis]